MDILNLHQLTKEELTQTCVTSIGRRRIDTITCNINWQKRKELAINYTAALLRKTDLARMSGETNMHNQKNLNLFLIDNLLR